MKNLFNLLGIVLISVSIVSCGGEKNNESAEPSMNQDVKRENEKKYPEWANDISPSDLEIIMREEEKCEEIRGKANEVENYRQWKSEMYGRCD